MTNKDFEKIYNDAYKAVYWTAWQLLKNEADAEDVVQDTFVSFIESYSDLQDMSKATALLKKIAANKSLNRIKLSKTVAVEDEFFENIEAVPEDFLPDKIVESAEMRKIIMDIIDKSLSDEIRRTLILFYFDEMSTREIAETLDAPEGTIRRRLNFARNKIKKEVEKYEKDNNTKLFAMAVLPFLSKLFIKEAEQVPFKAMPASLITTLSTTAKASSNGAGIKVAKSSAKKGTGIMTKKIVIASVASIATLGIIAGVVLPKMNKPGASGTTVVADTEDETETVTEEVEITETDDVTETGEVTETEDVTEAGEAAETTTDNENSTGQAMGREYYENGGDGYGKSYYIIQDLTPEEIVDLYVRYHSYAHEYGGENYETFVNCLDVKPEQADYEDEMIYADYSRIYTDEIDHVQSMSVFCENNNNLFRMTIIVYDLDRVNAIMDAYKEYYSANATECEPFDRGGTEDGGYVLRYDNDFTHTIVYTAYEDSGLTYYRINLSELDSNN